MQYLRVNCENYSYSYIFDVLFAYREYRMREYSDTEYYEATLVVHNLSAELLC